MLPQLLKRSLYGRRINLCLLFLLGFLDAVKIAPQSEYLANAIDARHRAKFRAAPMRLSHARKTSESYCRRHFHDCGWQSEMKRRASSVVGRGPQTATMRFHD